MGQPGGQLADGRQRLLAAHDLHRLDAVQRGRRLIGHEHEVAGHLRGQALFGHRPAQGDPPSHSIAQIERGDEL